MKINLGDRVRDRISGFEGIVSAKSEYLNGCVRILVDPESLEDSGKLIKGAWFDDVQIELVEKSVLEIEGRPNGGPSRSDPSREDPA